MKKNPLKSLAQLMYESLGKGLLFFLVFGSAMAAYAVVFPNVQPQPASGVVGLYVGKTSGSYDGNDAGSYEAANALCNADYPGSHVCRIEEVVNTYTHNASALTGINDIVWVNAPYLSLSDGVRLTNDCTSWSVDDMGGRFFAHVWNFDLGSSGLQQCHATHPFGCCH